MGQWRIRVGTFTIKWTYVFPLEEKLIPKKFKKKIKILKKMEKFVCRKADGFDKCIILCKQLA